MNEPVGNEPPRLTSPAETKKGDGCVFVGTLFAGVALFYVVGALVLAATSSGSQAYGIGYLVVSGVAGIALAFKRAWRGFAIGLLLGLGGVLLLIAICSGTRIGG
jgi:hypothetical protein